MTTTPNQPHPGDAEPARGRLARHARWLLWVYWLALALGTHWPELQVVPEPAEPGPLDPILRPDKLLHFAAFSGLMVLLVMSGLGARGRSWTGSCGVALVIGLAYAVVDELTQGLSKGREVDISDLLTNAIAVLGVYILALLPADREPRKVPRKVKWALAIGTPLVMVVVLAPGGMVWAVLLKEWITGEDSLSPHPHDYIIHGLFGLVVSVAAIVIWPMTSRRPRRAAVVALPALLLMAPAIEIAQHYTGRSVEEADALSHAIGVFMAMIWWAVRLTRSPELRRPASSDTPPQATADGQGQAAA